MVGLTQSHWGVGVAVKAVLDSFETNVPRIGIQVPLNVAKPCEAAGLACRDRQLNGLNAGTHGDVPFEVVEKVSFANVTVAVIDDC